MKRRTTDDERKLFKAHIDEPRPLKAVMAKPKKASTAPPPPRAKRIAGEGEQQQRANVAALAGAQARAGAPKAMLRRSEGVKQKLDGNTTEKLRRGELTPGARMDLHGMTEAAAHATLLSFLAGAQARGVRLALVITGVGNPKHHEGAEWMRSPHGVLKQMVPRWLNEKEFAALISGSSVAHRRHGGDGALYVYLRKKP
ncbi:MAG: Smr/MutS family protein [Alphaproteobacteria bacterium]|nr:Smr/MutS family protein [Alphaproteobacteria bacterium]